MKIFISEYIIFYETFDLSLYEELSIVNFFFDYNNYFDSLYRLNNRFVFKRTYFIYDTGYNLFLRKKQIANNFFWRRQLLRRNIYFRLIPLYFLPRKWMKYYVWWRTIPMCYKFFQYGYFNELVKHFYVNHSQVNILRVEFPKLDCSLIFNHVHEQFPRSVDWAFSQKRHIWRRAGFVFYKEQPYLREFLSQQLKWYKDGVLLYILNPDGKYFSSGIVMTYARKWVYYTYMIYNNDRPRPFIVYGYWTSEFFTEIFSFRVLNYRYEIFRDSVVFVESVIGTTENLRIYLYNFLRIYLIYRFLIWINIFFALIYSKEKMVKLIILDEHMFYLVWLYGFFIGRIISIQHIIRRRRIKRFKYEGREIFRRSHIESKFVRRFKDYIYIPISVWYLVNIINSKRYRNKIEKKFLGDSIEYESEGNYIYLFLIILNIPFRLVNIIYLIFYDLHIFIYLKLNKYLNYWTFYNPRFNFVFNRFFNSDIVYRRELDRYTSFAIIERILNYKNLYTNKDFRELITNYVNHLYQIQLHSKTGKRREEYYDYFYFRTFGGYEPEREMFGIIKTRFFTRWWYYNLDFSYNKLITHRFFEFFNFIDSPLHIRLKSNSIKNFYYILFYSKYYYYYYYYGFYFFSRLNYHNYFLIYVNYFLNIYIYLIFKINKLINFFFDGKGLNLLLFFFKSKIYILFLFLDKKYIYFSVFLKIFKILFLTIYYFLSFIIVNLKTLYIYIFVNLLNFFSDLLLNDFGFKYNFWYRYYIIKFYLIEFNIFYFIFKYLINFLFNVILLILFIFFITSIPYIKELLLSDYLIYFFYSFINKLFIYNKFVYFNEVLDNWWVPYFSPKKFIKFYYGYGNYFEIRFKKMFGNLIVQTAHLGKRRFLYNPEFFELYIKRYYKYLCFNKLSSVYKWFRIWFPDSYGWELYIYMSTYFWIVKHPARHFMPDIFFNTMPIIISFYIRYKYFLFVSKIFVPLYWMWKYFYSCLVFNCLYYTHNTFLFKFVLSFFKGWYNVYYFFNYYFFYFCYYYYFYLLFSLSKLMRYYFVTYDFLNYIWVYRSVRFIIAIDILNFFRFNLDMIYFIIFGFFFNFFQIIFESIYFILNLFGFTSVFNYLTFSLTFINKFHLFVSNWFDQFIALNYEIDEYGRILHRHFRRATRVRKGSWFKRDLAMRSFYKIIYRSVSFEVLFREFLFCTKRGLIKNFLIMNKFRTNTFNLFFFSFSSIYLHYVVSLFFLSLFSFRLRIFFKDETYLNFTPFFEWERFNKKNRHLLGRVEFYWLYNIRWLKRFEFYIDKHFTDDLYLRIFNNNDIKLGFYIYYNFTNLFVNKDKYVFDTVKHNKFLLYKRYYMERYVSMIRDIDLIFHEFFISKKGKQQMIYYFYDLFIPSFNERKFEFDFTKNLARNFSHLDYYWLYFAVPQLFYNKNWNFIRIMNKDELSKLLYFKIKNSLFKAYRYYEINGKEAPYDLFEFQFFEPKVYDAFILGNSDPIYYSNMTNRFLQKVSLSRWNMELVYETPGKTIFELYAHVGYHDWIVKFETYLDYLRYLNETYINNMVDLGIFSFTKPMHTITTHIDADIVKSSIDLSLDDSAIGVKYSELYQYEDLGRVATEQYLFKFLERAFYQSVDDPSINFVSLSEDTTVTQRHVSTWTVLVLILPLIMIVCFFWKYVFVSRVILPQTFIREFLYFFLNQLFLSSSPQMAEIVVAHKMICIEHESQFYWISPWLWTRTYVFDLNWIDRYSFWTGKYAKFLQSKNEFLWIFSILANDRFGFESLTFLYWNFYIEAWNECKESVLIFIILDLVFYLLCILFFLIIFNYVLWLVNFSRYLKKETNLTLDNEFALLEYRKSVKEKKKGVVFEFIDMDAFKDYRGRVDIYKKNTKLKKKKKNKFI